MLLLLDNYDSFTHNIYQLLASLGVPVEVIRNDAVTVDEIRTKKYDGIIISPGPGLPQDAGITEDVIRILGGTLPILGVCLGHQAIGEVFGGRIVRLYRSAADGTQVARYHSLIIERSSLPDVLTVTSELDDGTIMGVRHRTLPIEGIQFHPESILTPEGRTMMADYLRDIEVL